MSGLSFTASAGSADKLHFQRSFAYLKGKSLWLTRFKLTCAAADCRIEERPVLEVFANDRVSITSQIYPTRADSTGVALLAERGEERLIGLDAWQLRTI